MDVQSVTVIRRRPANRFPQALRNQAADVMGWSASTVEKTLAGSGWAWLPSKGETHEAALRARSLGALGLQAGLVSEDDVADAAQSREWARISLSGQSLVLHAGDGSALALSAAAPGGAALIGLRWDGKKVYPALHAARRPGLAVWGKQGSLGMLWLRDPAGAAPGAPAPGASQEELASFLQQAVSRKGLTLLDDSYQAGDIPTPSARLQAAWKQIGGAPEDSRAFLHVAMIRGLHRAGVFAAQRSREFDPEMPVSVYSIESRPAPWPRIERAAAWLSAALASAALRFAPEMPLSKVLGALAGLLALAHCLSLVGSWLRLKARPVSKIRSMAMGPVHISGEVEAAMLLASPMRGVKCVYYKQRHEQRYRNRWRTVSSSEAPKIPFYLHDATGRVLVDSVGAEWNGLEKYVHRISASERITEWVLPTGFFADVYGHAAADAEAPAVAAVRDGLGALFLGGAQEFDINRDGVLSDAERHIALQTLERQLKADPSNVSLHAGVYVAAARAEQLIVASHRALSLGIVRGLAAVAWAIAGFLFFVGAFVYPEAMSSFLQFVISSRWL